MSTPIQNSYKLPDCVEESFQLTEFGMRTCGIHCMAIFIIGCLGPLFIIACVGVSGSLSPTVLGASGIGLTGLGVIFTVLSGRLKSAKEGENPGAFAAYGVVAVAMLVISSLGVSGLLSTSQTGWGIIGISLGALPLTWVFAKCINKK